MNWKNSLKKTQSKLPINLESTPKKVQPPIPEETKNIPKNKQSKLPEELTQGATVSTIPAEKWGEEVPEEKPPEEDNTTTQSNVKNFTKSEVSDTDLRADVIKELVEGLKKLLELIKGMDLVAPNIPMGVKGNLETEIASQYSTLMGSWDELKDIMYKIQYQLQND
jgi:hypothetical protein